MGARRRRALDDASICPAPTPALPPHAGEGAIARATRFHPFPRFRGRPGWGRAAGARWMARASALPPPQPSPARGGGSNSACGPLPPLPPLAGKGRDGGRAAGARWMTRASALPPPQPSPARGGGSNSACDLLPLLPPLAGKGRDGGRTAGARWMTRASALPPPQPSPARGGGSRNAFTKTTPAASSGPARPAGRRPRRAGPARFR